jgi:hypothetical protein
MNEEQYRNRRSVVDHVQYLWAVFYVVVFERTAKKRRKFHLANLSAWSLTGDVYRLIAAAAQREGSLFYFNRNIVIRLDYKNPSHAYDEGGETTVCDSRRTLITIE